MYRCLSRSALRGAIALAVLSTATLSKAQTIASGPITNPGNNHVYYLLTAATWTDSETKAVQLGGHLATVRDASENDWIYSHFSNFGGIGRGLWIGLSDFATEGTYVWASGESVSYTNWGAGEPSGGGGSEDYVHMFWPGDPRASNWNDLDNVSDFAGIPINGVVELSTSAVPEPGCMALLSGMAIPGIGYLKYRRRDRR